MDTIIFYVLQLVHCEYVWVHTVIAYTSFAEMLIMQFKTHFNCLLYELKSFFLSA